MGIIYWLEWLFNDIKCRSHWGLLGRMGVLATCIRATLQSACLSLWSWPLSSYTDVIGSDTGNSVTHFSLTWKPSAGWPWVERHAAASRTREKIYLYKLKAKMIRSTEESSWWTLQQSRHVPSAASWGTQGSGKGRRTSDYPYIHLSGTQAEKTPQKEQRSQVVSSVKRWPFKVTFGHERMKLARLREDKGKACAGLLPSSSIWVSSSLGPGGTWEHT